MASSEIYPILGATDPVANTPKYTQDLKAALAVPRAVRGVSTATITLGTSTTMAPLPTDVRTAGLVMEKVPYVGTTGGDLECLLTFGGWSVAHAGAGDVRLGAQILDPFGNVDVDTGVVGIDWLRQVGSSGSVSRTRTVLIPQPTIFNGIRAQLMYAISGSPTTKTVGYAFVELTPLRWRYPS